MREEGLPERLATDETWRDEPRKQRRIRGWPKGKPRKAGDDGRGVPRSRTAPPKDNAVDGLLGVLMGICDEIDKAPHGEIGKLVEKMRVNISVRGGL